MKSKRTNSEIGSIHWFNTLIGRIQRIGHFLSEKDPPSSNVLKSWGKDVFEDAAELCDYYSTFSDRKVNISFTGTDIENKQEFADAMGQMISLAIEQSKISKS